MKCWKSALRMTLTRSGKRVRTCDVGVVSSGPCSRVALTPTDPWEPKLRGHLRLMPTSHDFQLQLQLQLHLDYLFFMQCPFPLLIFFLLQTWNTIPLTYLTPSTTAPSRLHHQNHQVGTHYLRVPPISPLVLSYCSEQAFSSLYCT